MSRLPEELLGERLRETRQGPLAVAESCTGGLIAHRITRVPGASDYFDRGLIVYSYPAKVELLGVDPDLMAREGAVSRACAVVILEGLFDCTPARLGAAVTGTAGPDGGTPEKPVGTVWIAWGRPDRIQSEKLQLTGDRVTIQEAAAEQVLQRLCQLVV